MCEKSDAIKDWEIFPRWQNCNKWRQLLLSKQ